jgi:hypothetical protein
MQLTWHPYKYYPYERDLAQREIQALLAPSSIKEIDQGVHVERPADPDLAQRLVYFSGFSEGAVNPKHTQQSLLERVNGNGVNRQSTRYSAHGLHEYKGKFNPQVAKALLNIFDAHPGQIALDPFCGSGTSLVECAHLGIQSVGTDINPLAVFLANAKLRSLSIPATELLSAAKKAVLKARRSKALPKRVGERGEYLSSWFSDEYLPDIERLRLAIETDEAAAAPVLLAIASNLLRDYSLQEPNDLRIRRRVSPFPSVSFFDAYEQAANSFFERLAESQQTLGIKEVQSRALHVDCKNTLACTELHANAFDLALTSPPYATALPYIDTQRLSLVWLSLIPPSQILPLEATLVGSREIRGGKSALLSSLELNEAGLPEAELSFCNRLQTALTEKDGFRRQVVPRLLYRYFSGMAEAFSGVRRLVKHDAPFGLIVGGNHTVLSGTRYEINTPDHLASIAKSNGWRLIESVPLQTYRRYGLHVNNATTSEALLILRAA